MGKSGSDFVGVALHSCSPLSESFAALFEDSGGKRKSLQQQRRVFARLASAVCRM